MSSDQTQGMEEQRVNRLWSNDSYQEYARVVAPAAADLVDFVGVSDGDRVLDVACGTGNTAITAARRGANATGVDLSEAMLERARENAALIDADVDFRTGNALDLPVDDDSFDVVLSTFGHHLASDPVTATEELMRVARPGGRVGFAAYGRESGPAKTFEILSEYHPELSYEQAVTPYRFGDSDFVAEQFGDQVESLSFETGTVRMKALSPRHFWEYNLSILDSVRVPFTQVEEQDELMEEWVELAAEGWERNAGVIDYLLVRADV
jgi:ubiquinone/menaquinone biosynthesis C-methylase UbiE